MPESAPRVMGAVLAVAVLVIYAVLLGSGAWAAFKDPNATYTPNSLLAADLVTGLVGSVVAVGLALEPPGTRVAASHGKARRRVAALADAVTLQAPSLSARVREAIGWAYLLVWLVIGLAAFLVAVMRPTVPDIVFNTGWTWLGTAVAAAYAYFGIQRR